MTGINVAPERLLEIIREEHPMVYDLAVRRAVVEQQQKIIESLQTSIDAQSVSGGSGG